MSDCTNTRLTYTARGRERYEIVVSHASLHKYQVVSGDDQYIVQQKAQALMARWDEMWERRQAVEERQQDRAERKQEIEASRQSAAEMTQEAQAAIDALEHLLAHTLSVDDTVDWDALKDKSDYAVPESTPPEPPPKPFLPEPRPKPEPSDVAYKVRAGLLGLFLPSVRERKEWEARERYNSDLKTWQELLKADVRQYNELVIAYNAKVRELSEEHRRAVNAWRSQREEYVRARDAKNAIVEAKRTKYLAADPDAIGDYCDLVLSNSKYPDYFPQSYELDYNPANHVLIVDYELPPIDVLPTLREVKYAQSKDDYAEKHMTEKELARLYDDVLYQVALRTIHELYEADNVGALASIVFNGYVQTIDKSTGKQARPCLLSVQANREEFAQINLASVEPKACFRKLKGVSSAALHSMTPVAPVLAMDREDARFIEGRPVVDGVGAGYNLAAMDWEDFEHLIREVFEAEFAAAGGEVKVTRASRDGGIDAVAFDPDPIRGGKTVIQAKRYTNTVSVSAVRELYGAVINEGANKGVLVTTADYGPDAYEFAKGKPLVLLSGSNLLHMLEKHGHRARIDLQEARRLLSEQAKQEP